jgi:hypothetical protein
MVWIKYSDYGKKPRLKKATKKKKRQTESRIKIIPGKHKAEFKKASEI